MKISEIKYKGIEVKSNTKDIKDILLDKIECINDFEAPKDMIQNEVSRMVAELNQNLRYEALRTGDSSYLFTMDINKEKKKIEKEAIKQVKVKLILDEIIRQENIQITKDELEQEAENISKNQHISIDRVKDFLGEDLKMLEGDLLIRKAIDIIYKNAIIKV